MKRTLFVLGFAVVLTAFFASVALAQAPDEYQEFDCGHRLQADPQARGADGVWFTADPSGGWVDTGEHTWTIQYERHLVIASSAITFTQHPSETTWSCYYSGTMPDLREWELAEDIRPGTILEVDSQGDFVRGEYIAALPLVVEFGVNSPDGYGANVETGERFHLVATIYSMGYDLEGDLHGTFHGIDSSWEFLEPSEGSWDGYVWTGAPPTEDEPLELVLFSPKRPVLPQATEEYAIDVRLGDGTPLVRRATVHNPTYALYLPLIASGR